MRKILFCIGAICLAMVSYAQAEMNEDGFQASHFPATIEEAIQHLDTLLSKETKAHLQEYPFNPFGVGLFIRNNWLRPGLPLNTYLKELDLPGFNEPDGMSSSIIRIYANYLDMKEPDAGKAVKNYLSERRESKRQLDLRMRRPDPGQYPQEVKGLVFSNGVLERSCVIYSKENGEKTNRIGLCHLAQDTVLNKYWLYDYDYGWKKVSKRKWQKVSRAKIPDLEKILKKIY